MAPKSVMCVIVEDGSPFVVDIDVGDRFGHLKKKIQAKKPLWVDCEADALRLYAANKATNWRKSGKTWIQATDPSLKLLEQGGQISSAIEDILDDSRELISSNFVDNVFNNEVLQDDNVIHILVKLPGEEHPRKRLCTDPPMQKLDFKAEENYVNALLKVGMCLTVYGLNIMKLSFGDKRDTMIYCRKDTMDLLKALDDAKCSLLVDGPPGMGKSVTTWFWACNQVKQGKSVLWIHASPGGRQLIVRLESRGCYHITPADALTFIEQAHDHIVVVDGVTHIAEHCKLEEVVFSYFTNLKRKAISVACMSWKRNMEVMNIASFRVVPWTLQEYVDATESHDFFISVQPFWKMAKTKMNKSRRSIKLLVALLDGCLAWRLRELLTTLTRTLQGAPMS
ncbi:unnamed protein product [Aphanomyces euteiches]|nr:hypothetical protein AeRB84_021384 [Aphanomyces euteiches]